jgi:hypothetical protein
VYTSVTGSLSGYKSGAADQFGGHELAQGDLDRGWPNRPAAVGQRGSSPALFMAGAARSIANPQGQ